MIEYIKHFKNNNSKDTIIMSFNAINNRRLEKYNEIWKKVSSLMDIKLDSEPVYGDKYIGTKIRQYEDKKSKFSRQKNTKRKSII